MTDREIQDWCKDADSYSIAYWMASMLVFCTNEKITEILADLKRQTDRQLSRLD